MHLARLQVTDVKQQQPHVNLHRRQTPALVSLSQVAPGAISKQRTGVRSACQFNVDLGDFASQKLFSLFEGGMAEASADADAAMTFVDEAISLAVESDAGGARRGHGVVLL